MIVLPMYEGVDLLDVTGPFEMFHWAEIDVLLVARTPGPIICNSGLTIQVSASFQDASAADALWTPGGDPDQLARLMRDAAFLDFLVEQSGRSKYTASVCEGALLLAAAGLLDGYTVTTHWNFMPCLSQHFPKVTIADGYPRFCLDRNRLTGGGISAGLDESLELIRLLKGEDLAREVQQSTQYYPDPPVRSEIPHTDQCPVRLH